MHSKFDSIVPRDFKIKHDVTNTAQMELTVVGYVLVIAAQRKDSGYTGERMLKMDEEKKTTKEIRGDSFNFNLWD